MSHLTHYSKTHHNSSPHHLSHLTHQHNSSHHLSQHSLPAAGCRVAGAVHRAFWTSCGARGRRLGRGWLSCGRRSTQSLLEELRRAWSPLGPRLAAVWQAQHTEPFRGAAAHMVAAWAAAASRVAGAVHRAFWRSCRTRGRRLGRGWLSCGRRSTQSLLEELRRASSLLGPRLAAVWQAQYTEPSRGAAARVVAAWAAAGFRVARRSTQSLLEELRRAWSPLGPRLAAVWQAQYTEPPGGAAARVVAAWAAARRSTQSLLEELLRAGSPLGPRLAAVWHAQYTEPPGGAAARVVAAWAAARRSTQSLLEELLRAGSPLGLRLAFRVAGAVHRAFWRSCCAPGRRSDRGWLSCGVALGDINFHFKWQVWYLVTSTFILRGRRGTWRHRPYFAWQAWHLWLGWLWWRAWASFVTHHLSHNFVIPSLSRATFTHTHTSTHTHTIFHTQLCHTPSLAHRFVTHHLSHTIFVIPLCHTTSVTHHLS